MNLQAYGRPGDRRATPRVTCTLPCAVAGLGDGKLLNVSDGGAYIALPETQAHPPRTITVRLNLGDAPHELPAEVVRVTTVAPHGIGLGIQFRGLAESAAEQIHRLVLARLLAEIAEIMEGNPRPVDPRNVQVISGVGAVARNLRDMLAAEGPAAGTLFQRDVGELVDIQLVNADHGTLTVSLKNASARPAVADHIHLTLTRGSFNAHAHTTVLHRDRDRAVLEVPSTLTIFELRRAPRRAPTADEMFVAIPLPYPPGKRLRREVLDISSTGLAFKVLPDEAYFLPGTPLREVVISGAGGDAERRKSAQIMHITPVTNDAGDVEYLRVGLDFGITDDNFTKGARPRAGGEKKSVSFVDKMGLLIGRIMPRRAVQTAAAGPSSGVEVVRYSNKRREDIVALLNTTPRGGKRLHCPVIVIPPAHGKRKESTSVLAQILVETFAKARRDVVVLRFDGIRNIGESYKDPDCREQGKEALRMSLSQGVEDLQTTLDYVYNSPLFTPTEVVLCCFSLMGVAGRRAAFQDQGRRVHYLIGINGAPAAQELIRNAAGGVDYIAQYASGKLSTSVAQLLGINVEAAPYCDDLIRNGLALMGDAKREIANIPIPVTWILGRHDAWIDPATIREFMAVPTRAPRELIELDVGHLPLTSHEAITLFSRIVSCIGHQILHEDIEPAIPDPRELVRVRNAEWRRVPKSPLPDRRSYWNDYLLGDADHKLSYDVLNASEDYIAFLDREADLLDLRPEHSVADMGTGTGNFAARLLKRHAHRSKTPCARLALVDFVPGALDEAERKLAALQQANVALPAVTRHCVNLDISPVRTLRRFVAGELFGYDALKGILRGLVDYSLDAWRTCEDWRLHDIIRGRELDKQDLAYVRASYPPDEQEVILDMNRLSRWLRGRWTDDDLTREGRSRHHTGEPAPSDLRLARIVLKPGDAVERLPFADASLDRINCSLVLSYLNNPLELLREFHRVLAPGGRLVASSMLPDVDMSRIYQRLLYRIEQDPNLPLPKGMDRATFVAEVRHFLSSAAFLVMLAEEGQFAFFSREEMCNLVERAGFRRVENTLAFGDPPQAHITVGHR